MLGIIEFSIHIHIIMLQIFCYLYARTLVSGIDSASFDVCFHDNIHVCEYSVFLTFLYPHK